MSVPLSISTIVSVGEDEGSGPADTFTIRLLYTFDQNYHQIYQWEDWNKREKTEITINYDEVVDQSAIFNNTIDFAKQGVVLKDGIYQIDIIIYDRNNNQTETNYYFAVDHTPPTPVNISAITPSDTEAYKYTLGWEKTTGDIKRTTVYYTGDSSSQLTEELGPDVTEVDLQLDPTQKYEFYLEFEDFNGHVSYSYDSSKPESETNRKVKISGDILNQVPQKMPSGYEGTVENGFKDATTNVNLFRSYRGLYFKFGDFPQSKKADSVEIVSSFTVKDCGFNHSETTYSIGDDGYLYKKIKDCKTNQDTWFKVEPIIWRYLTELSNNPTLPISGDVYVTLLAENVLIGSNKDVGVPYYKNNFQSVYRIINGHTWGPKYYPYSTLCAYLKSWFVDGDPQAQTTNSSYAENGFSESAFTKVDGRIESIFILNDDDTSDYSIAGKNNGLNYSSIRERTATDYAVATGASRNSQWWITENDQCSFIASNGTSGAGANYNDESTGILPAIKVPRSIFPSN